MSLTNALCVHMIWRAARAYGANAPSISCNLGAKGSVRDKARPPSLHSNQSDVSEMQASEAWTEVALLGL
jgi:hypothetical protein